MSRLFAEHQIIGAPARRICSTHRVIISLNRPGLVPTQPQKRGERADGVGRTLTVSVSVTTNNLITATDGSTDTGRATGTVHSRLNVASSMASPSTPSRLALSNATEHLSTLGMTSVAVSGDSDKDRCGFDGGNSSSGDHTGPHTDPSSHDRFASTLPWPPADAARYLPPGVLASCVPASFDDFCRRMAASAAAGRLPAVLLVSAASWAHMRPQIEAIIGAAAACSSSSSSATPAATPAATASSSDRNGSRGNSCTSSRGSSSSSSNSSPVDLLVVPLGEGFRQRAHAAYAALPRDGPSPRLARQFGLDVALASLAAGDSAARGGYMPRSVPALLVARTAATAGAVDGSGGSSMYGSGSSMYGSLDEVELARQQQPVAVGGGAATATAAATSSGSWSATASMDGHGSSSHSHGHGHGHGQGHGSSSHGHRHKGGRRRRGVTFDGPYPAWCMLQELSKHVHRHALAAAAATAAAAQQHELQAWRQLQEELQAHHRLQAQRHQQHELRYLATMQGGSGALLEGVEGGGGGSGGGDGGSGALLSAAPALRHT